LQGASTLASIGWGLCPQTPAFGGHGLCLQTPASGSSPPDPHGELLAMRLVQSSPIQHIAEARGIATVRLLGNCSIWNIKLLTVRRSTTSGFMPHDQVLPVIGYCLLIIEKLGFKSMLFPH